MKKNAIRIFLICLLVGTVIVIAILTSYQDEENTEPAEYKLAENTRDLDELMLNTNFKEYKIDETTRVLRTVEGGKTYNIVNNLTKVGVASDGKIEFILEPAGSRGSFTIDEYTKQQQLPPLDEIIPGTEQNTEVFIYYEKGFGIEYNKYSKYLYNLISFESTTKDNFSKNWGKNFGGPGEVSEGVNLE